MACSGPRAPDRAPPPQPIDAAVGDTFATDPPLDALAVDATTVDASPARPAFDLRKLDGPYASIRAYCATKKPDDFADFGARLRCNGEPQLLPDGKTKLAAPMAPFAEARLFVIEGLDP